MGIVKSNIRLERFFNSRILNSQTLDDSEFKKLIEDIRGIDLNRSRWLMDENLLLISRFNAYFINPKQVGRKHDLCCFAYKVFGLSSIDIDELNIECFIISDDFSFCINIVDGYKEFKKISSSI